MKKMITKALPLFLALILVVPMIFSTPAYAMQTSKTNKKVTTSDGKKVVYVSDDREIVIDADNTHYHLEVTTANGSVAIVQPNDCFYRVKLADGRYQYYTFYYDYAAERTDTSLKSDDTTENGFVIGKGQISDQTSGKTTLTKFDHILKKYTGAGGNVVIPEGVEVIASDVFNNRKDITSVTFPKSLVYIEGGFRNCTGLTTVSIPESAKYVSMSTFSGCSNLASAIINGKDTFIFEEAFGYATKVTIYGLSGSKAQWLANYYGIKFKTLDQSPIAKGSLMVDTTSYTLSPKSSYVIGTGIDGYGGTVKASSNNSNTATVTWLGNGKFKVTGVNTGTTSIVFGVYNSSNKQIAHISVLVTVQNGIASSGNATKQIATF